MTSAGATQVDARGSPRTTPMPRASSATKRGGSDRFFVAAGSIAGAMQCVSNPSSSAGTKLGRVNTTASAPCRRGSRTSQARCTRTFGQSAPTWQRQITVAPNSFSGATSGAVCGSWSRTTSPGATWRASASACKALTRSKSANSAAPRSPPSPRLPCSQLCSRLVTRKNGGVPRTTAHRALARQPRQYGSNVRNSSATPPPEAAELTDHTLRSASSVRVRTAHRRRSSKPSAGRKGRRRAIGAVPTGTSANAGVGVVEVPAACIASMTVRPRARISIRCGHGSRIGSDYGWPGPAPGA